MWWRKIRDEFNQATENDRFEMLKKIITSNGELMYVGTLLRRAAMLCTDVPALIYDGREYTYQELYLRASFFAQVLKKNGIQKGDKVLLRFENCPEFYVAYFAIWQSGAVVAPINTFLKKSELAHIISDAHPKLIITSSASRELFTDVSVSELPVMLTELDMDLDNPIPADFQPDEIVSLSSDEMCALLYTSGTTGLPKGVMLSSRNIMLNMMQGLSRLSVNSQDRIFAVLPLFHVFAQSTCVWGSIFTCCTVILVPKIDRRKIMKALKHKPTIFFGVPALYGLMCLLKTAPFDYVRLFVSGGDALPDKIRAAFALLYRRKICNGYGMTEASPFISANTEDELGPTNNIGQPLIGVSCEIRDEEGNVVQDGVIGDLWTKGPGVMLGYYQAPEFTSRVIKDGWLNTGDLAYKDARGKLVITGRLKDLIIHKGFNIYPQEIENVILMYPNVLRVGIVGKRDEDVGEVPIAFVQLRKEEDDIESKLKKLCAQHLAFYKIPKIFNCTTDQLPITATGKVDKKVLRKKV